MKIILAIRLFFAERAYRYCRAESAYHDGQKCAHRNAASEYRFRARHHEAEIARLRVRIGAAAPVVKRLEA